MEKIFSRPESLVDCRMHYCPGCTHGIIHRLVAETIDELGARERTVGVAPVGCSVLAYEYFNCDMHEAAHGRAPAVATGIKRVHPNHLVFSYQGDGDLASIGTAEIIHAAARGENITVVFVNNGIYGMTGGQMAPTTLPGAKTTTSPFGRDPKIAGNPIRMSEIIATLDGAAYVARVSVSSPTNVLKAKKAIKAAFDVQEKRQGLGLVEVLSTCPTCWGMHPVEALKWLDENMASYYKLGEFKVPSPDAQGNVG